MRTCTLFSLLDYIIIEFKFSLISQGLYNNRKIVLRPRRLLRPSMMMRPTTVMQRDTTWSSWSKLHQTLLELVVLPLCASEAQDLLLLKHRIAILLASHPRQTSSVLFLVRAAFAGLSVQQPNNLSQEAPPLPFWLSFSFSLSPPPSFFASIVSSRVPTWPQWGSVLSNARRPTTTIVERWDGGHGLEHVHFYTHTRTHTHTHTPPFLSHMQRTE